MMLSRVKQVLLGNERINKLCASLCRIFGWNRIKTRGNSVVYNNTYLTHCAIRVRGKNNQIIFNGTNYFNKCKFYITGDHNCIIIGDKVCGYDVTFIIEDSSGKVTIGDKTLFTGKIEIACTEGATISIGKECLFSSEIDIRNGDSHSIFDKNGNRINKAEDICIGDHVWVGHRALMLKGSVIGCDSVIGSGAVVTRKFAQNNVAIGGNPAKIIKEYIHWEHERL